MYFNFFHDCRNFMDLPYNKNEGFFKQPGICRIIYNQTEL